jgi:hypothetical protein
MGFIGKAEEEVDFEWLIRATAVEQPEEKKRAEKGNGGTVVDMSTSIRWTIQSISRDRATPLPVFRNGQLRPLAHCQVNKAIYFCCCAGYISPTTIHLNSLCDSYTLKYNNNFDVKYLFFLFILGESAIKKQPAYQNIYWENEGAGKKAISCYRCRQ